MEYKTTIHKHVKAKLHTVSGFTFAELMLTMLILALMTGVAAWGVPVVIRTYQRAVNTANAETYLNTTMIALRSRLCVSKPVLKDDGTIDCFEHPQTGYYKFRNSDEGIQIVQYLDIDRSKKPLEQPLAPSEKKEFVSSYDDETEIEYDNKGFFTIKGLQVKKDGKVLARLEDEDGFVIHTVNP